MGPIRKILVAGMAVTVVALSLAVPQAQPRDGADVQLAVISAVESVSGTAHRRDIDPLALALPDASVFDMITTTGEDQGVAEPYCDTPSALTATLRDDFGEAAVGDRIAIQAASAQVWASNVMKTWTVVLTRADGIACIMASGTDWSGNVNDAMARSQLNTEIPA